VTRNEPVDAHTSAAPPVTASGELASICTVTTLPLAEADTVVNSGAELGDVELPPQAVISTSSATSERAWPVRTQNARRGMIVCVSVLSLTGPPPTHRHVQRRCPLGAPAEPAGVAPIPAGASLGR